MKPKGNKFKKALATFSHSGKIGLQYHGKPVLFRNINVTELDEDSPDLNQLTPRRPTSEAVQFHISLTNGTSRTLTDIRLQNCVLLRGAPEFSDLTRENKILTNPYVAVHNAQKTAG